MGAECSGKTTLAQALAAQLGGLWVPEYLRTFCDKHGRTPQADEQAHILGMQLRQENEALAAAEQQQRVFVFCDTAPLQTAIYSDCVFGDTSLYEVARSLHARYALTLLLEPDIPWVADGFQRDGPRQRAAVHDRITRELSASAMPFVHIHGTPEQRLLRAITATQSVTHSPR